MNNIEDLEISMQQFENIIIGAGFAGLGAAYALSNGKKNYVILESRDTFGGLCSNFEIDGFRFDRFVHLSFSNNEAVNEIFRLGSPKVLRHTPNPSNIYKGKWIKHPAQNNLYMLEDWEKKAIIEDFLHRPAIEESMKPANYEEWLRWQYGNYFAEHFPMVYTMKYWMREAKELRTEWVGNRLYQPSVQEVISGSKSEDNVQRYYAKEMRYPEIGGYSSFVSSLAKQSDIRYNTEVKVIDAKNKTLKDQNGNEYKYTRLISSMPLPEIVNALNDVPEVVKDAAAKLACTHGYHISIALNTKRIPPYLWWYIYDEDCLAARVHSPSMKSPDNAPEGCSSLQMEVYCDEKEYTEDELKARTVGYLIGLGIIHEEDILFVHIGYEKYANVIFTEPIYGSRKTVRDYLSSVGIETIGRFGEWDYLWSDQSLMSGMRIG